LVTARWAFAHSYSPMDMHLSYSAKEEMSIKNL